jgi:two-component sensor histidine kinase
MRQWIWLIVFLPVLVLPTICPAAYLIELKTGSSFVTNEYWEEDGQIKFNHYGGIMGVSKEMIAAITDSDAPVPKEIIRTAPPVVENLPESLDTEKSTIDNNKKDPEFQKKEQEFKETQWRIQNEMATQASYFNTAKEQNDQAAKDEAWNRLIELNKERKRLKQKAQELNQGTLPEWWDETYN